MRLFVVLVLVAFVLAGCGGRDWDEGWSDADGNVVPDDVLETFKAECVDGAIFLLVAWPLGTRVHNAADRHWYVRDPEGTLESWGMEVGPLDIEAALPNSARNTGYRLGDLQLWLGRDARKAAYLVEGKAVERWPRLTEGVGCQ